MPSPLPRPLRRRWLPVARYVARLRIVALAKARKTRLRAAQGARP